MQRHTCQRHSQVVFEATVIAQFNHKRLFNHMFNSFAISTHLCSNWLIAGHSIQDSHKIFLRYFPNNYTAIASTITISKIQM